MQKTFGSRLLALALAVAVLSAPIVPAFAFNVLSPATDGASHHMSIVHDYGDHADPQTVSDESPCAQHDACQGQCCATCAQCSTVTAMSMEFLSPLHSVRTPVVPRLHASEILAQLNRPPRVV